MLLGALFAGIALFLAAVGIYGVLAYQVAQRRREIGIRLALGSEPRRIFRLVLKEGLLLLGVGLAVGLGGAFAIRRAIETQLFGVRPLDPLVLATSPPCSSSSRWSPAGCRREEHHGSIR